jgi:hypothetical protein
MMPELSQSDFTRGVRGAKVVPGQISNIEPILKGLSSISRAAVRRVHKESPDAALAYFADKTARFRLSGGRPAAAAGSFHRSLLRYIEWDGIGEAADLDVTATVPFGSGRVRARAHVVLGDGDERRCARLLLWDDLSLDERAAEMIALPIVECVNAQYGQEKTAEVQVWQLALSQRYSVEPMVAQARRVDVEGFLDSL